MAPCHSQETYKAEIKKAIESQWLINNLVEMRGIEPLTSALRTLRSPN
jgi:hypothetical protein